MPDITITSTVEQSTRARAALGKYWNLKDAQGVARSATAAEVKNFLIKQLRGLVYQQERKDSEAVVTPPAAFDPT